MSNGVNKVFLIGRLGADPEGTNTPSGSFVCKISIATKESWNDKNQQKQTRTEWHRCVCWGKRGEALAKNFHKGDGIFVEGRLQTRSWEDKDQNKRYATEIIVNDWQFLPGSPRDSDRDERSSRRDTGRQEEPPDPWPANAPDDDIPF